MTRLFQIEIEGVRTAWRVAEVHGTEQLHGAWRFRAMAHAIDEETVVRDLQPEDLITRTARLSWTFERGGERILEGVLDEVVRVDSHYELVLVPRITLLADSVDHRVFLDRDALTIAKEILDERGIRMESRAARSLPKRAQCVQAFEPDLEFVSRILAEEGIVWFLARTEMDVVIATDTASGFERIDGELPLVETRGLVAERSVFKAKIRQRVVTDKVSLRAYDFLAPHVELRAEASADHAALETYEFPGSFRDSALGKTLANIRLEERRCRERVLAGEANTLELAAGHVVKLEAAGIEIDGIDGEWVVLEVQHEYRDAADNQEHPYRARFLAAPRATPHRPQRQASPRMGGVQNATMTGPSGREIHTEEHARVKALFRWDRRGKKDDHSSTWVRTLQPPTSGGFFLPRVGWEVLVGFSGVSADCPLVLGRLYNSEAPPPNALPASKVVSAFGTLTTPGGGTGNLVQMSDAAGNEGMAFNASSDFNERTENDKVTSVAASEQASVGGDRKLIVGQVHKLGVAGAQTHSVGGSRDVNVNANMTISAGAETVSIGGLRKFQVGGDSITSCSSLVRLVAAAKLETAIEHQTRAVSGASAVLVGGSWNALGAAHASVSVGGVSAEVVGGPKKVVAGKYFLGVKGVLNQTLGSRSVTAGASHDEGYGAAAAYSISGSASLKGADVIIAAESSLTIKASGITITITPGSVKIDGKFDGSVGSVDQGDETYA